MSDRMNILFIQTDQQRRDLIGCYGDPAASTPVIDSLASEGVLFENCFAPTPLCAPSRASLLTGLRALHHGITRNEESGSPEGRDFLRRFLYFTDELHRLGYDCRHIGKWHVGTRLSPEDCGFRGVYYPGYGYPIHHPDYETYCAERHIPPFRLEDEHRGRMPDGKPSIAFAARLAQPVEASEPCYLAQRALEALQGIREPFFLRVDFWGPHEPCFVPEPYYSLFNSLDLPPWPSFNESSIAKPGIQEAYRRYFGIQDFSWEDWLPIIRAYYGYVTLIDGQIGRIISEMKRIGAYENTAVFFTSDHGGMLGAHRLCDKGPYLYDELLRVPLIARIPGRTKAGTRNQNWICNYDLMPTFIETAGGRIPPGLDAQSFLPLFAGGPPREAVMHGEFFGHQLPCSQRWLRTREMKYIFNGSEIDELYDLHTDPHELRNLAGDASCREILREMRIQLFDHIRCTGDPIAWYFERTRLMG